MPVNKLALLRYKTIDNCLRNRQRKWTLDDLVEHCSEALYEYEGIENGVSRRTIQLDLQNMRSEKLGYSAPIIVTDRKYYIYEERDYSITKNPLSRQDVEVLTGVVGILKQFKGFGYYSEMTEMVSKLEDRIYKQQHAGVSYIDFEKNELLKGLEFIEPLHKAILKRQTLLITYQSFKSKKPVNRVVYPYLLKEFRNRWFLLVMNKSDKEAQLMALDRMAGVNEINGEPFIEPAFDVHNFFTDVIGVSKHLSDRPQRVVLRVDKSTAPYIITKPLHPSQQVNKNDETGMIVTINVVLNLELEREILGFGDHMTVLTPRNLKNRILKRLKSAVEKYELAAEKAPE